MKYTTSTPLCKATTLRLLERPPNSWDICSFEFNCFKYSGALQCQCGKYCHGFSPDLGHAGFEIYTTVRLVTQVLYEAIDAATRADWTGSLIYGVLLFFLVFSDNVTTATVSPLHQPVCTIQVHTSVSEVKVSLFAHTCSFPSSCYVLVDKQILHLPPVHAPYLRTVTNMPTSVCIYASTLHKAIRRNTYSRCFLSGHLAMWKGCTNEQNKKLLYDFCICLSATEHHHECRREECPT